MSRKRAKPPTAQTAYQVPQIKGRPLLTWVGKQTMRTVKGFPARPIERFESGIPCPKTPGGWTGWPAHYPHEGLLFHGDNKEVLGHLLAKGFADSVKLIYIDPPFDSGADYVRKVKLRMGEGAVEMHGQDPSVGEQKQYTDIWADDRYLQFMHDRLMILKELLAVDGFIVVHMNSARVHYIKVIMDEIFGSENFRNEIVVRRIRKSYVAENGVASLNEGADYLLLYSKSPEPRMQSPMQRAEKKERFHSFDAPGVRPNLDYPLFGTSPPYGRHWMKTKAEADKMTRAGDLRPNPNTRWPEYRLPPSDKMPRDTLWDDITASAFTTGYPTEKKEKMLEILVEMTTDPGDLVLDCFMGSGTTIAVAQKLGRKWIGCDINQGAVQTTAKRLQVLIATQLSAERKRKKPLIEDARAPSPPAQLGFSVHRINDYDLQIQHNEAVALACEHIGVVRNKTDKFFDGSIETRLVKIAQIEHPLGLPLLQELEQELKNRPEEDRDIVIVCLGAEKKAEKWIEDHNRTRGTHSGSNRLEIIDLRSHPEYGKLFGHVPAVAKVDIRREKGKIIVDIRDFSSPSVVERMNSQRGILAPKVDDFRAFIDNVKIDLSYNGTVFNVALHDLPSKKHEQVTGHYEMEAPRGRTNVAVKITDVLGEEVLVTCKA